MCTHFTLFNNFIKRFFSINTFNLICFSLISLLTIVLPSYAQDSCITYNPPASWKEHFPFDLIYPIGEVYQGSSECPTISFWGTERQVCSIKTITGIVKNIFLFRVVIHSLFTL